MNRIKYLIIILLFLWLMPLSTEAAILAKPPSNLGLVGYWSFNEGTSTSAGDFSGNKYNGTITGTTWVNGKRGKALNFDGSGDGIDVIGDMLGAGDITISTWIKANTFGEGNFGRIIDNTKTRLLVDSASGNKFIFSSDGATNAVGVANSVRLGEWQHVIVTRTSIGTTNIYINGILNGTADQSSGTPVASAGGHTYIGNNGIPGSRSFDGIIDDIRVYNRILSAAEVATLYGSGSAVRKVANKRGLIANYSFDDGAGTKLGDYSGNKRDITLSNTDSNSGGWISGKKGKAFMFDGGDDQATVSSAVYSNISPSQGTIMGWGYATTTCSNCFMVWAVGAGNSRYYIQWTTAWRVFRGDLSGITLLSTANTQLNRWYHIALTWEGGNMYGYLDGKLVSSKAWVGDANTPTSMVIGRQGGNPGFTGALDDIKMYDRALTAAEIATEYSQGSAVVNAPQNDQLTEGLVGLWSFNGKDVDSTYVYDRSGNANHGYFSGVSTSSAKTIGKVGQGFALDGVNDKTSIPDSTSLDFGTGNYTVAGWIYVDSSKLVVSNEYGFINKNATYAASAGWGIEVSTWGGTAPFSTVTVSGYNSGQATWGNSNTSSISFNTNEWHHIALIRSGSTHTMYVDGVLRATKTHADVAIDVDNTQPIVVGDHSWGPTFPGKIDEVRIYNRALSASEVKRLYLMGK